MEILLSWNLTFLPQEGIEILRVDHDRMVYSVKVENIRFVCENFDENELPTWEINTPGQGHTIVYRKAFPVGWCDGLEHKLKKMIRSNRNSKFFVFIFYPSYELPPVRPGISGILHYIRDIKDNCVGHFEHVCQESEDQAWKVMEPNPWSVVTSNTW